jgi:hypothetical protein
MKNLFRIGIGLLALAGVGLAGCDAIDEAFDPAVSAAQVAQ